MNKIVFTCGDINGIGPEIVIKSLEILSDKDQKLIYCCPNNIFRQSLKFINKKLNFQIVNKLEDINDDVNDITVIDLGEAEFSYGKPTSISGITSYNSINTALDIVDSGMGDAIITAPISKMALKLAGVDFPGHTELLGARYNINDFKMMFLSDEMKCALTTIHERIQDVPKLLNIKLLRETVLTVINTLKSDLSVEKPKIAVLGLNPHAGEDGKIGSEELEIINPVINEFKDICYGPFVPDAFFGMQLYKNFDIIVGMYHDQVLIPFKLLNFESGVNYTSGLPIVRTSPDHGTAYDIAGKGIANPASIIAAVKWAEKIVNCRKETK